MKLEEVRLLLDAMWTGGKANARDYGHREVRSCAASDLMSDVLNCHNGGSLLLTGLTNAQAIRTAEISDFVGVCFVRGKQPQPEAVRLAEEKGLPLMTTPFSMFEACGRLYGRGVRSAAPEKEVARCPTRP
jgi:predicted transcriptional regulator